MTPDDFSVRTGLDGLTPARVATLFRRAPLLRPTDDLGALWRAFENSPLVVSLWDGERLVALARVLTDGAHVSYLCDFAVEPDEQGAGVGARLLDETLARCAGTEVVLRDSALSAGFWAQVGFTPVDNAWVRPRGA